MSRDVARIDRELETVGKELDKLRFWYLCIGVATILNGLSILTVAFRGAS
jgi:hypothetical protein